MATPVGLARRIRSLGLVALLALGGVLGACVSVTYPVPGAAVAPRPGETLVFGRLRFFHDGREYFPWSPEFVPILLGSDIERHLWLLRLGRRAVSAELHPDADGSLAIWLAPGDYALLGSTERPTPGAAHVDIVALLRVPDGDVTAYAGELSMKTVTREGGHWSAGEFSDRSVELQPLAVARVTVEQRLGTLPTPPVVSSWCVTERVPAFDDPDLALKARELLDNGCGRTP